MKLVYECFVWFPLWAELRANVLAKQSSTREFRSVYFTLYTKAWLGASDTAKWSSDIGCFRISPALILGQENGLVTVR